MEKRSGVMGAGEAGERGVLVWASPEELPRAAEFVAGGLPEGFARLGHRARLACEELFLNVCHHAYGGKGGLAELSRQTVFFDGRPCLTIRVRDWGPPFNPFADPAKPPLRARLRERAEGGLGIHITQQLSSHSTYARSRGANINEVYFFPEEVGGSGRRGKMSKMGGLGKGGKRGGRAEKERGGGAGKAAKAAPNKAKHGAGRPAKTEKPAKTAKTAKTPKTSKTPKTPKTPKTAKPDRPAAGKAGRRKG